MRKLDWEKVVTIWANENRLAAQKEDFIEFFRLAFENTRFPDKSWFGSHCYGLISLVVGGIFLAAVAVRSKTVWVLVDKDAPKINGVEYSPTKSTRHSKTPLLWASIGTFKTISEINKSNQFWRSFAKASEKIFNSPVVSADRDNLQGKRGKTRVSRFFYR
jgi:hypothetical protein